MRFLKKQVSSFLNFSKFFLGLRIKDYRLKRSERNNKSSQFFFCSTFQSWNFVKNIIWLDIQKTGQKFFLWTIRQKLHFQGFVWISLLLWLKFTLNAGFSFASSITDTMCVIFLFSSSKRSWLSDFDPTYKPERIFFMFKIFF